MTHATDDVGDTIAHTDEDSRVACSSHAPQTIPATYTPDWLAKDMANLCEIQSDHLVLEPSAGLGALAIAARRFTSRIHCYELNGDSCHQVWLMKFTVARRDFLKVPAQREYHRVLMNPPSQDDRYVAHILHALKFLLPGGRLVALIGTGYRFATGALTPAESEMWQQIQHNARLYQVAYPRFTVSGDPLEDDIGVGAAILMIDV